MVMENPAAAGSLRKTSLEAAAFDRWLCRQLDELYGSIAREPLPADLVALIDRSARELPRPQGVDYRDAA